MEQIELADWRRRVNDLYHRVRSAPDAHQAWRGWRAEREELFLHHPQTPLRKAGSRAAPDYFDYDPAYRVRGRVEPAEAMAIQLPASSGEPLTATRFAEVHFSIGEIAAALPLFWLGGYAGGLFLAFRDPTSGNSTYGGGRYVLDSAKGADLGGSGGELILDFNFSYQPSCSYSPEWACPLPVPGATLPFAIEAGEKLRDSLEA